MALSQPVRELQGERMTPRVLKAIAVLMLPAALCLAEPGEWTRFRGPNGTGISDATTIPVTWTPADYNWQVKLPGGGHSSPVLWGDRIFVTCADAKTARRIVACISASDGKLLWQKDFASTPHRQHRDNSFAAASPAVDADGVYATWTAPDEVALLALSHSGKLLWRRNLGKFKSQHGSGTSPIVCGGLVVLANDQMGESSFIAVDRKTGATKWRLPRPTQMASYSTPAVYRPPDGAPELIFTCSGIGIVSVAPETGEVNWEIKGVLPARAGCSPVFGNGVIIGSCGIGGRGVQAVAVRPGSKDAGTEPRLLYKIRKPVPYVPTPLVKDDLLFAWSDEGTVQCLRLSTGEEVWRERVGDSFYGSPVCAGGRLYCISKKGVVFVLAAAEQYKLLAKNRLGELAYTTPAIAGGRMYIRTHTHLISLGGKK